MKYDLHVHTNFSDGKFTPTQVVDLALSRGLDGIAITDHDTVLAIAEAIEYSNKKEDFIIIPGIELGCVYKDEEVHILGYFIDYKSKLLLDTTNKLRKDRIIRGREIIEKLQILNIKITEDEVRLLCKDDFIGRVHIARVLVNKNYVKSISEAFDKYLNSDSPAYVSRKNLSIEDSIKLINDSGGIAVLAHPGIIKSKDEIIERCIEKGIQGIEYLHSKHSKQDTIYFKKVAKSNNLIITAGSDCHGELINNDLLLGNFCINENELLKIEELI